MYSDTTEEAILLRLRASFAAKKRRTGRDDAGVMSAPEGVGLPPVTQEQLDAIVQAREERAEADRAARIERDLSRRHPQYNCVVSAQALRGDCALHDAAPTADVDGKAHVFGALRNLFRMAIIRSRVKRRLDGLANAHKEQREKLEAGEATRTMQKNQGAEVHGPAAIVKIRNLDDGMAEVASGPSGVGAKVTGNGTDTAINDTLGPFHVYGLCDRRPPREPFAFRVRRHQREPLPEFVLDVSAQAAEEVVAFRPTREEEESGPTLEHFAQPLVTLETYAMPAYPYCLQSVSKYGGLESAPVGMHSLSGAVSGGGGGGTTSSTGAAAAAARGDGQLRGAGRNAILMEDGLLSRPKKMVCAIEEDSLSEDDSEMDGHDVVVTMGYDYPWPIISTVAAAAAAAGSAGAVSSGQTGNGVSGATFDYFVYRFTA